MKLAIQAKEVAVEEEEERRPLLSDGTKHSIN
jgi:hypothetical protein